MTQYIFHGCAPDHKEIVINTEVGAKSMGFEEMCRRDAEVLYRFLRQAIPAKTFHYLRKKLDADC